MPKTPAPVRATFPGAVEMTTFLTEQGAWLASNDFTPGDALAVAATCRDELASEFRAEVRRRWHWAFDFASLSGLPLAGTTAMRAVIDHAPHTAGYPEIVIFALPHIGVLEDGTIARAARRGRSRPSTACASLFTASDWVRRRPPDAAPEIDPLDPEQSLVRERLAAELGDFSTLGPIGLTQAVADLMVADLWRLVEAVTVPSEEDVAVVSGILVHGPDGDYVQPRSVRLRRNGVLEESAGAF